MRGFSNIFVLLSNQFYLNTAVRLVRVDEPLVGISQVSIKMELDSDYFDGEKMRTIRNSNNSTSAENSSNLRWNRVENKGQA